MAVKIKVQDFNLDHIFDCGQCFRWNREEDGSYTGVAFRQAVNMSLAPDSEDDSGAACCGGLLTVDNTTQETFDGVWHDYLDLDRDYGSIKLELSGKDSVMSGAVSSGRGIRILRQEPWETLISFIISQNNNIPRIKKCIEGLCELFGEPLGEYRGKERFAFPEAEVLAGLTEEDLAPVRLGYRAKYIISTAKQVAEDRRLAGRAAGDDCQDAVMTIDSLREASVQEGYDYLTGLCGVGPKVANCILLFGMAKQECFPIDVWVRRVMNRMYGIDENDMKTMKKFAEEKFGEHGGIAQQYLFYHIRQLDMNKK